MKYLVAKVSSVNRNNWEIIFQDKTRGVMQINRLYEGKSLPIVGDNIVIAQDEWGNNFLIKIDKRKNFISRQYNGIERKMAANIDIVFIVSSLNKEFSFQKLERLAVIGLTHGSELVFVLTKKDLCENYADFQDIVKNRFPNNPVIALDATNPIEVSYLKKYWQPGESVILVGSSGVGKSTIINSLFNDNIVKTGDIRAKDDKGKHTTTARHLYIDADGRILIDTPGIRSMLAPLTSDAAKEIFEDFDKLEKLCEFSDCVHTPNSRGCAIQEAINNGDILEEDYIRYLKLKRKQNTQKIHANGGIEGSKYEKQKYCQSLKKSRYQNKGEGSSDEKTI